MCWARRAPSPFFCHPTRHLPHTPETCQSAPSLSTTMSAQPDTAPIRVGVLLFDGFEPLDVVGPVSILASVPGGRFQFAYIGPQAGPVTSETASMTWVATHAFADMQPPPAGQQQQPAPAAQRRLDWLLVPGGIGTRKLVTDEAVLDFLRGWCDPAAGLSLVMSVCTGSALLAAAGVLDGRQATSNKAAWQWVTGLRSEVAWVRRARWVQDGRFLTSSGVSAGTDAAVAAVKAFLSGDEAAAAARRLEHVPITEAGEDPFADEAFVPRV